MNSIKVLIIDDNPTFLNRLSRFLTNHNTIQVVGELESGRDILDMIQSRQPNVVVTDLAMPDISGFSIIKSIKQTYSDIVIVALTMYDNEEYRNGALEAGAHTFITKSRLNEDLMPAISGAFEKVNQYNKQ